MRTKNLTKLAILMLACGALWQAGLAQERRRPTTPEERRRAVEVTRQLEAEPSHSRARRDREWLMRWLIEAPDISVTACSAFLEPAMRANDRFSSELFAQMIFGQAAFVIEHPERADDHQSTYLAGLESSLRMYESHLRARPQARHRFLDELLERRSRNELGDYVREKMAGCR